MMSESMAAFLIWAALGCGFLLMGIYMIVFADRHSHPFGFWANADTFPVKEGQIKAYNRAVGKLWCAFGSIFVFLGLPLLSGSNTGFLMFSVLGVMGEVIGVMIVYVIVIEKKYKKP